MAALCLLARRKADARSEVPLTKAQYRGVPGSVVYACGTDDVRNEVGVRVYVRWP